MTVEHYDPTQEDKVSMTHAAIVHLQKKIAERGRGMGMYLTLKKSGCAGYRYDVSYVDSVPDNVDITSLTDDLSLFVDLAVMDKLKGTQIDYVTQGLQKMFVFRNPQQKHACGCGESVEF